MRTIIILSVAALAISACAHKADTAGAPSFGDAVARMQQAQAEPTQVGDAAPESGGATGVLAQTRYKTGQTAPLLPSATSIANASSDANH